MNGNPVASRAAQALATIVLAARATNGTVAASPIAPIAWRMRVDGRKSSQIAEPLAMPHIRPAVLAVV